MRPNKKNILSNVIFLIVVLMMAVLIYFLFPTARHYFNRMKPPDLNKEELVLFDKAILEIQPDNARAESARKLFYPAIVRLPNMNCVGLNPKPGIYGRDQTVCFDKSNDKVMLRHVE